MRSELAALEHEGYLTHPHTSAGRVPTDSGYRFYADSLITTGDALPAERGSALSLDRMRREVEEAMRETTAALSQMTDLLALVDGAAALERADPPRRGPPAPAEGRDGRRHRLQRLGHQAGLQLRATLSTAGLVEWASSYLNERLSGLGLGARMIAGRLADPELSAAERRFLDQLEGAFTALETEVESTIYVDGTARLLSE